MKEEALNLLQRTLQSQGYSFTQVRQQVFDLLWEQEPQSMRTLEERALNQVDRASIYRTISLFQQLGLAQRINIGWKYKIELTDVFTHHHHHVTCMHCGKVIAITEDAQIESLIEGFAAKYKLTAVRHQLEIQGYCQKCTYELNKNDSKVVAGR